jgi:hypothetical protein
MAISSGAKKDLLVLNLCIGLIGTVLNDKDEAVKNDKDLIKRTNKNYKLNKRIDRRLEKLFEKLQATSKAIFEKYGRDGKLGKWMKTKLNTTTIKVLNELRPDTNLELLANQVLFECFMERDKPLIEELQWLADISEYSVFDMLVQTEAGSVEGETYQDAIDIVKKIKG